ncbi:hypothetical protein NDU88_010179 [Pleurodeles waltl]|uniref:Uncharacterized protein n=1 Tax=Pleurodeles waltl TaxID=8319 RepID=A0AAV7PU69_PLEWA|nr:hypothetical protein NDU88_010179 [Pleurodeles waltl]
MPLCVPTYGVWLRHLGHSLGSIPLFSVPQCPFRHLYTVAAEGGRGKGGSAGHKGREFTAGGRSPLPLAPCRRAYQRLPSSFTNSPSAASSYHCCACWRVTGCPVTTIGDHGCCRLPLPPGVLSAVGAVGNRVLVFSPSRREPPGRGVCCVFVRYVHVTHSCKAEFRNS